MPQASASIFINAEPVRVFEVITDFARYPEFLPEVKEALVEKIKGRISVSFEIRQLKTIRYKVLFKTSAPKRVEWTLDSGEIFKKNSGIWNLRRKGRGTEVHYAVDVEFDAPVPSFIVRRLVDAGLPAMLDRFKDRVERAMARAGKYRQ